MTSPAQPMSPTARAALRLGLLAAVLCGGFYLAWSMGWLRDLDADSIRHLVDRAGVWGIGVYLLVFCLAELVHVPGMIFVGAALLLWGPWLGAFIGWLGCVLSVMVTFLVVRSVGGKALSTIDKPWMKKALAWLERSPVLTIIALRSVMWVSPPLNYLLALSTIRFRDFVLGSALGLIGPVGFIALAADRFLH